MFGIGPGELVVIIIVALVVLGPEKLPAAARTLGRLSGELRRMSMEFQRTMNMEVEPGITPKAATETPPAPAEEPAAETAESQLGPDPAKLALARAYIAESSAAVPEASREPAAAEAPPAPEPAKERDPA